MSYQRSEPGFDVDRLLVAIGGLFAIVAIVLAVAVASLTLSPPAFVTASPAVIGSAVFTAALVLLVLAVVYWR